MAGGWCLWEEQQHEPRGPVGITLYSSSNRDCGHTPMRMQSTELWPWQEHPDLLRSRAAITTLGKSVTTSALVWECYEALNKLAEDNQVTVLWSAGHRGIKSNETADRLAKLAKLATKQNPTGLEPVIGISNRSVTEDIKKWLAEKHQEEWYKATACSRTELKTLTEVFIGHGNHAYHRHKIGLAESSLYRLCGEDNETSTPYTLWLSNN